MLVAGPPCSGKTTWARERADDGDLVLDSDALYAAFTGLPLHERLESGDDVWHFVWAAYEAAYRAWLNKPRGRCFVLKSAATLAQRKPYRDIGAEIVILETPVDTCIERAERLERPPEWPGFIRRWWSDYEPEGSV